VNIKEGCPKFEYCDLFQVFHNGGGVLHFETVEENIEGNAEKSKMESVQSKDSEIVRVFTTRRCILSDPCIGVRDCSVL
jgi:hypothetical protein